MAELRRCSDLAALSAAAADDFIAIAKAAVAERDRFDIALSGGSTPKGLFHILAARGPDAAPWDRTFIWWGDERCVPPDHPDSNYGMARAALLDPLGIDPLRVFRMRGEAADPADGARVYEQELLSALGEPPVFDYNLLGMGPDGHTASLFPHSPGLDETTAFVIANHVDSPLTKGPTTRITITAATIAAARHTRVLVAGAEKASALHAVLEGRRDPHTYPSQLITGEDVVWFVDAAAAGQLST